MFGVYAAEVEYRHSAAMRDRELRRRALRAQRQEHDQAPSPTGRAARMRAAVAAWPRPIVVHAGGSRDAYPACATHP